MPRKRGPHGPHKTQGDVLAFLKTRPVLGEPIRARELARLVRKKFDLDVHPRTIERAFGVKTGGRTRADARPLMLGPSLRIRTLPTLISIAPGGAVTGAGIDASGATLVTAASIFTGSRSAGLYSPACNARCHLNTKFVFSPCSIGWRATETPGSLASLASRRNSSGFLIRPSRRYVWTRLRHYAGLATRGSMVVCQAAVDERGGFDRALKAKGCRGSRRGQHHREPDTAVLQRRDLRYTGYARSVGLGSIFLT